MRALGWGVVLVLVAAAVALGLVRRLQRHRQFEGASFVVLQPAQPVSFMVHDAPWIEIVARPAEGHLAAVWLGADAGPLPLSLTNQGSGRTFRLAVPASSTRLELTAEHPVEVRVLVATPARYTARLRRLAFLASERRELLWSWKAVAPEGDAVLRRLAEPTPPRKTAPPASPDPTIAFAPGQTRGWVVSGPAELSLVWLGEAPASVSVTGSANRAFDVEPGSTSALRVPAGASQLQVTSPRSGRLQWITAAGHAGPVSTERLQRAHLVVPGQRLRFPVQASRDVALRLSAWLVQPGVPGRRLSWRLGAQSGERSLDPTLATASCLVTAEGCARVGARVETQLALSAQVPTDLELTSDAAVLVTVDTQFEPGADPRPRPPFDDAPPGFQWEGAPARASRWVFLRPIGAESGALLALSATLEPERPREARATISAEPKGAHSSTVVLEPGEGKGAAFVPIAAGAEREVLVDATGARARRLGLSCVSSEIGGVVALTVDAAPAAQRTFTSNDLLLELPAAPGLHRVRLAAPATARCHLVARPAGGGWRKRTVYPAGEGTLDWVFSTSAAKKSRVVGFIVYGAAGALGPTSSVRVTIDGGNPTHASGPADVITVATREVPLGLVPPVEVKTLGNARAFDRLAVVRVVLGDDLALGRHRISIGGSNAGLLWFRAWTEGHRVKPERAEGWITTEEAP